MYFLLCFFFLKKLFALQKYNSQITYSLSTIYFLRFGFPLSLVNKDN